MHSSILLTLWALVSYILYRIAASLLISRRHAAAARQLGCQPAYRMGKNDPLGIVNIWKIIQADRQFRIPQYLEHRTDTISINQNKNITTSSQRLMGSIAHFTSEPRNIQAVLATQFKDFGLGEGRIRNFSPLLGHGVVSTLGRSSSIDRKYAADLHSSLQTGKSGNTRERCFDHSLPGTKSVTWILKKSMSRI